MPAGGVGGRYRRGTRHSATWQFLALAIKTPSQTTTSHRCGIYQRAALSHTALTLESRSWKLLLFQLLESSSQPPGPGKRAGWMLSLLKTQRDDRGGHLFPRHLWWRWVFLNHEFEQKLCCTLNVTARQKESHESSAIFPKP